MLLLLTMMRPGASKSYIEHEKESHNVAIRSARFHHRLSPLKKSCVDCCDVTWRFCILHYKHKYLTMKTTEAPGLSANFFFGGV